MKRHLTKRNAELEKLKKESLYLKDEEDRIQHENATLSNRYEDVLAEVHRIESTNRSYQERISEINTKIGEAKNFLT